MNELFVCPICKAGSNNPKDAAERYCARCEAFPDDVLKASTSVRRAMIEFQRGMAETYPLQAGYWRRQIAVWSQFGDTG